MAVKIINEEAFDDNFRKEIDKTRNEIRKNLDKEKDEIISKYQSDKYDHKNLDHEVDKDNNLNFGIDKYTGKLILNKVSAFLKQTKYRVNSSYDESPEVLNTTISNAFYNKGEVWDKYNAYLGASSRIKSYLNFNDPKKSGNYYINLKLEIYIRSCYLEEGSVLTNNSKNCKCEILVRNNLERFPSEEDTYNKIMNIIMSTVRSEKTQRYWDLKTQDIFSMDHIFKIKSK